MQQRRHRYQRSWSNKGVARKAGNAQPRGFMRYFGVQLVLLLILILSWAYLLLFMDFFQIKHVVVLRNDGGEVVEYQDWLSNKVVKNHMFSFGTSYFMFSEKALASEIRNNFPIQNIDIKKEFPKTVMITLSEEKDEILVYSDSKLYRTYTNGEVVTIPDEETPYVQKITEKEVTEDASEDQSGGEEPEYELDYQGTFDVIKRRFGNLPVLFTSDAETVDKKLLTRSILHFTTQIQESGIEGGIGKSWFFKKEFDDPYKITILGTSGWKIIFDNRFDLNKQFEKVETVLIQNNISSLDTIDVRFDETVFIKRKD